MNKLTGCLIAAAVILFIAPVFCALSFAMDTEKVVKAVEKNEMPAMAVEKLQTAAQAKAELIDGKNSLIDETIGNKLDAGGVIITLPPKINEKAPAMVVNLPIRPKIQEPILYDQKYDQKVVAPKNPQVNRPIPILEVSGEKPKPIAKPAYEAARDLHQGANLAGTVSMVETTKITENKMNEIAQKQDNSLPVAPKVKDILGQNLKTPHAPRINRPIIVLDVPEEESPVPPRNSVNVFPAQHIYGNGQGATLVGTVEIVKQLEN